MIRTIISTNIISKYNINNYHILFSTIIREHTLNSFHIFYNYFISYIMKEAVDTDNSKTAEVKQLVKNATDLQRLKLERLMKNPDKPVYIPEPRSDKKTPHVPEFVRNVMGSSAGAGSGEFHVYRHLRRKEYARQKHIQLKADKELLEEAYRQKILENQQMAEERTAKKRAKRLKRKKALREKSKITKKNNLINNSDSDNTTDDD